MKAKQPKTLTRLIHAGTIAGGVLELARGVFVRVTDESGAIVSDSADKTKRLIVNMGHRLVVCGADLDANAVLEVVRVEIDSYRELLHVRAVCGELPSGAVHVMSARGLGEEKKRRAA